MNASARWQWLYRVYRVYRWCASARPAAVCAVSGGALTLITITVGLLDAVGVTKVIALSLAAGAITIAGLINCLISDSRTAWRRGFQLGCRVGVVSQRDGLQPDSSGMSKLQSQLSLHRGQPTARRGSRG
jgi:hypothetical protein